MIIFFNILNNLEHLVWNVDKSYVLSWTYALSFNGFESLLIYLIINGSEPVSFNNSAGLLFRINVLSLIFKNISYFTNSELLSPKNLHAINSFDGFWRYDFVIRILLKI